ncbi:MAG: hypothetical protein K9H64_00635 [Bacteroidales bacterium]|nr:hypothetical protein [Bacteroidales bacterium]MCF8457589.1 hypothetical protein [Bacteroidales bacterium]
MKEGTNIDQLFNKKLKGASVESAASVGWAALASQLDKGSFLNTLWSQLWVRVGSIALSSAIVTTVIIFALSNPHTENTDITYEQTAPTQTQNLATIENIQKKGPANKLSNENTLQATNNPDTNDRETESSIDPAPENDQTQIQNIQIRETGITNQTSEENKKIAFPTNENSNPPIVTSSNNSTLISDNLESLIENETSFSETSDQNTFNSSTEVIVGNTEELTAQSQFLYSELATPQQKFEQDYSYELSYISRLSPGQLVVTSGPSAILLNREGFSKRKMNFALSAHVGYLVNNTTTATSNEESKVLAQKIQDGIQETEALTYGIKLSTHVRHLYFETGLDITSVQQKENHQLLGFGLEDNSFWDPYWRPEFHSDTTGYFQYNNNDTIWVEVIDNYFVNVEDSTFVPKIDTFSRSIDSVFANSYSYIEIPFVAGYMFSKGKIDFILKTGLIAGIPYKTSGNSITGNNEKDIYTINKNQFPTICFDIYAGIEARYLMGARYFVFGDLVYRKPMNSFYSWQGIKREQDKYGLRLGIGFNF